MSLSPWWLFLLVPAVAEVWFAFALFGWHNTLGRIQQGIDEKRRQCYACITGASVTSFGEASVVSFCNEHRAHWFLIHDLEKKVLDGPI